MDDSPCPDGRGKRALLLRVSRMRGQVDAIERALETEAGCEQVMHRIAGVRGAMAGLMGELVERHVRARLVGPGTAPANLEAAERLIELVQTYIR